MERYSFFDAQQIEGGYDRVYSSADMARYFSSFIGNGVYANPANQLMVVPSTGLTLKVKVGKAWINGYYYELTQNDKEITISTPDSVSTRIDRVVLRLNLDDRLIEVKVIEGTPSQTPSAPDIVRTDTTYDLCLATVTVPSGATGIASANIQDTRPNSNLCGWVYQVIDQIDTTNLFAQYDDEFDTWFDSLQTTLDGDVATNLATQITDLQTRVEASENTVAETNNQIADLSGKVAETVSIAKGGTGATTASEALTNLGASASDHKHSASDITSGTLPISRGGTGASSAYNALKNLGITIGTTSAPATGTANSVYIQLL